MNSSEIPWIFINTNQIILPFKTEEINIEALKSSKYIEAAKDNKIYTTIEIGDPPQKVNLYITMDTYFLLVANSSINYSYFNSEKSKTYYNSSKPDYYFEYFSDAYFAYDNFIFQTSYDSSKTKIFNNIEFIHIIEYRSANYISPGYLGLQFPRTNKINFFDYLKKSNVISSPVFNLNYTSDKEGYLSIGEYPSQYNDNSGTIKKTNALPCSNGNNELCWYLKFNDIQFGDIKVNREREAEISPGLEFIKGTKEYMEKIRDNYFGKILKNECKEIEYENYFRYYECDKNADISSFKDLVFSHQELYDFVLTKEDLFKVYDDKLYFLIIFDSFLAYENKWKLGKPFIKKYSFVYDIDNKLISYYEKKENAKGSNVTIYWIIIGILIICILVMIVLVVSKIFFEPKKKKAKELKEDIDYNNIENKNENALGIS